jgi:hypothetical protein
MQSSIAVMIIALALGLSSPFARGADAADDLVDAQRQLVESARAYRETLDQLLIFQEQAASRAAQEAAKRRSLLEQGIVSRREVQDSEQVAAAAMSRVKETLERRAEADALLAETLASIELARVPRPPAADVVSTPSALRYDGGAELTSSLVSGLERFFAQRFARSLPVSARGQTPVHDRLGLDHRGAIDVAVHPDSEEGRALIEYLRVRGIPFLAFRGPILGSSTGAHIHLGRASIRLTSPRPERPSN